MQLSEKGKSILKWTGIVVTPAVVGFSIYWICVRKTKAGTTLLQQWKDKLSGNQTTGTVNTGGNTSVSSQFQPSGSSKSTTSVNSGFPLMVGSSGSNVSKMQSALNQMNLGKALIVDGQFGPATKAIFDLSGYKYPLSQSDFNRMIA